MSILKENKSFEAEAPIWGVKYHTPNFVLEIRDHDNRTVKYVLLNDHLELKNLITPSEEWLVTLEGITNDELILSTFNQGETPTKKDILIYSLEDSKESIIENHTIIEISVENLSAFDNESKEELLHSINNKAGKKVIFPTHYAEDSEHLLTFTDFLKGSINKTQIVSVDYLEHKKHLILSYFCKEGDQLNSYLLITDKEGNPIHQFETGKELNGIAFDTFFIIENRLYYIANKNTLCLLTI